ncbi:MULTISPECIES: two component system response regulator [Burkholderia]|uniref:Two-component system response regulator n=1 Tax=Burkholderia mayonis TaxID=1385591 RepID=A0A1B4FM84_9BURK|nr:MULTISPECIES: two component system response regulator [Burkholderia]AOJ04776.1 two-component system response regulator [Burkholderia mayonis]KVE36798.1 two-component system response regulator [Burkholderia sp. BDU5]KVE41313.1 two-component system response regulator [Burkholderia mayonis]
MALTHTAAPAEIRILVVEDHPLLRLGLKNLLDASPPLSVVDEVSNGLEVYAACQRLDPDIVLLDLGLPGMNGLDVIHQLRRRWPDLGILIVTAETTEHRASAALTAGANGYLLKNSSKQTLLDAIWKVWRGHTVIDPALNVDQVTTKAVPDGAVALTPRERQVLKLISEGCRNRDIAEKLTITIKTVETHRLNLMRKLDAHNAAELANWAHRLGLH